MDRDGFVHYLKQRGKAQHVVAELIAQVERFDIYLRQQRAKNLETANEQDVRDYAAFIDSRKSGQGSKSVRGVALYYRFTGRDDLANAAAALRETAVAAKRSPFPLKGFPGVNVQDIARLRALGIVNAGQMLAAGKTPQERDRLAQQSGISLAAIIELVKLSDLTRIFGVKGTRARLYHDAGVDSVDKMAACEPDGLLRLTAEFVQRTGFPGIAPLPKEIESTIAEAQRLPKIVTYEEK